MSRPAYIDPVQFTYQAGIEDDEVLCVRCWSRPRRTKDGRDDPSIERTAEDPILCNVCYQEVEEKKRKIAEELGFLHTYLLQKQRRRKRRTKPKPYQTADGEEVEKGCYQQIFVFFE